MNKTLIDTFPQHYTIYCQILKDQNKIKNLFPIPSTILAYVGTYLLFYIHELKQKQQRVPAFVIIPTRVPLATFIYLFMRDRFISRYKFIFLCSPFQLSFILIVIVSVYLNLFSIDVT